MIGLGSMAAEYGVDTADAEGYELQPAELRESLISVLLVKRDEVRRIVERLGDKPGSPCPNLWRGELRAARHALVVIERDLHDLACLRLRKIVDTTAEPTKAVG